MMITESQWLRFITEYYLAMNWQVSLKDSFQYYFKITDKNIPDFIPDSIRYIRKHYINKKDER